MAKAVLTDKLIHSAKPGSKLFDAKTPGLWLRVNANGSKSWSLSFTRPGTATKTDTKLGSYPDMTLADARLAAHTARAKVANGVNPVIEQRAAKAVLAFSQTDTIGKLVEKYIGVISSPTYRKPNGQPYTTAADTARDLRANIVPVIGTVALTDFKRGHLFECTDIIMARGSPVAANRTFAHFKAMMAWATEREIFEVNPVAGLKRKPGGVEAPRQRNLQPAEIAAFWRGIDTAPMGARSRLILKLELVTGQRGGEVTGMALAELDLPAARWLIPGERTKNGRENLVPLSDLAMELIGQALALRPDSSPFVFPGKLGRREQPQEAKTISKGMRRATAAGEFGVEQFTAHDLRRTMTTRMAELGVEDNIVDEILNHTAKAKEGVRGVYNAYKYEPQKRVALDGWAVTLRGWVGQPAPAGVLPFTRRLASQSS